jgi:hypothetical protein
MRPNKPLAQQELDIETFSAAQHLLLSSGKSSGGVDGVLQQRNLKRRISMVVNHFASIQKLLINTDMITTTPCLSLLKV